MIFSSVDTAGNDGATSSSGISFSRKSSSSRQMTLVGKAGRRRDFRQRKLGFAKHEASLAFAWDLKRERDTNDFVCVPASGQVNRLQ